MSKIKIIGLLILFYVIYKVVVTIKNFEIGVEDRVSKIEKLAEYEKEDVVIGLMMYSVGDPPKLKEHLFTPSKSKCLELKEIAEESSLIYFECEKINAVIKDGKIIRVIEKIEVFE